MDTWSRKDAAQDLSALEKAASEVAHQHRVSESLAVLFVTPTMLAAARRGDWSVPGEQLAGVQVPQLSGAIIRRGHGQLVIKGVALQDVYLSLVTHQALRLHPRLRIPHPDRVVTHRR